MQTGRSAPSHVSEPSFLNDGRERTGTRSLFPSTPLIIPSVSRPQSFPPYRNVPRDLVRRQPFESHGTVYDAFHRYPARECGIPP